MTSLALLGLSLAAIAVFFGCATLVFLLALLFQPAAECATHPVDPQHQSVGEEAAPSQAPLQRVDRIVDLSRGAGLRREADGGGVNSAAAGVA